MPVLNGERAHQKKRCKIMQEKILKRYLSCSLADKYIIGYEFEDYVYYVILDVIPQKWVTLDRNKDGQPCLRLKLLTTAQKKSLINISTRLCTLEHLYKVNDQIHNLGYAFEKIVWSKYKRTTWHRDNTSYYKASDMMYKGTCYQIKFQRATLTKISTLERAEQYQAKS